MNLLLTIITLVCAQTSGTIMAHRTGWEDDVVSLLLLFTSSLVICWLRVRAHAEGRDEA